MTAKRMKFCFDEGAAVIVEAGRGDGGTIFVQQATVPTLPGEPRKNAYAVDAPPIVPQPAPGLVAVDGPKPEQLSSSRGAADRQRQQRPVAVLAHRGEPVRPLRIRERPPPVPRFSGVVAQRPYGSERLHRVVVRVRPPVPADPCQIARTGQRVVGTHRCDLDIGNFRIRIQMRPTHKPQPRQPNFHESIVRAPTN